MNSFIRIIAFLLCSLTLLMPLSAWGQTKVGIVNVPRLLKESEMSQVASKMLKQEFEQREQDLRELSQLILQLKNDLERNSATMSDSDRNHQERELADKNRDLQRKQREFREDLERRQNEETGKIIEKAQIVINDIAELQNYDLILRDAVFASPKADITDQVIEQLTVK